MGFIFGVLPSFVEPSSLFGKNKREVFLKIFADRLNSLFFLIGTSLLPVYIFGSGGVQPAHVVFLLFFSLTLFFRGIPFNAWSLSLVAAFFYFFAVESFYVVLGADPKFMINSVFFLYNLLLAVAVYVHVRENGLSAMVPGVIISACIAITAIMVTGVGFRVSEGVSRSTGTFNNPNQLGYFSVCLLSICYLLLRHKYISYWVGVCIFSASLFLSISSLSKAAMAANFMVIIFALKPASSRSGLLRWFGLLLLGIPFLFYLYINDYFADFLFVERFMSMTNEGDSSLESRGYFAFLNGNALQIMFGIGTQGVDQVLGHEVHSTLASVLNNYGFIGFVIFCAALCVWANRLWKAYGLVGLICLAGPPMLYGLTHNGIRFTIFWILFAASMAMASRLDHNNVRLPSPRLL